MIETTRKMREAMYSVFSFHNVGFREILNEHKLIQWESFSNSVDLVLGDPPRNFRLGRQDSNSHYDVLALEVMEDAALLCKRAMKRSLTAIYFYLRYRFVSGLRCCQDQGKRRTPTVVMVRAVRPRMSRGRKRQYYRPRALRCTTLEKWGT